MWFTALSTAAGVLLIGAGAWDIVQTVVRPGVQGRISHRLMRIGWATLRLPARLHPKVLDFAGPMLFLTVVATWVTLLATGWAFLYWPHMPEAFLVADGLSPPAETNDFVESIYLSLVTLGALGYGDVAPAEPWLRVVAPLEAMFGIILFSATIWWLLSIYPVLGRQRAFVRELMLVRRVTDDAGRELAEIDEDEAAHTLGTFSTRLVVVRDDLAQLPETYYFHPGGRARPTLPGMLPYLVDLAEQHEQGPYGDGVRYRARLLRLALDDLAEVLDDEFLAGRLDGTRDVFRAYAADHLVEGRLD